MKTKFRYLKLIDKYFSGTMTSLEKEKFEQQWASDKELDAEIREYQKLKEAIHDDELLEFHQTIRNTFASWERENKGFLGRYLHNRYYVAAAAGIAIMLIAGITMMIIEIAKTYDKQEQFAQDTTFVLKDSTTKEIAKEEKEVSQKKKQDTIPENPDKLISEVVIDYEKDIYKISPIYKEMLGNNLRSGRFILNKPADSTIFEEGEKITFEFSGNYPTIHLDILNHKGLSVRSLKNITPGYQLLNDLPPGAYLLRFQTSEEPVWWGVVFIGGGK